MADRQDKRIFSWTIDPKDIIIQINDAFLEFARENEAPQLSSEAVLNRPLWSFITGAETVQLYMLILEKVRRQGSPLSYPFRCDSPGCRRFLELQVSPCQAGCVNFLSRILRLEFREPVKLLEPGASSELHLRICSWCKKVYCLGEWLEIELAVKALDLFSKAKLPGLTHGICEPCSALVLKSLTSNDKS